MNVIIAAAAAVSCAPASPTYVDSSAQAGLAPIVPAAGMTTGVAAGDYDNDGDIDLFIPTGVNQPNRLYRNRGDGTFENVAPSVGLAATENHRAALWFDYDGDDDLDLLVAGDNFQRFGGPIRATSTLRLYRQESPGSFVEVTSVAGLQRLYPNGPGTPSTGNHVGGLAVGDLNNDGWLDIVAALWYGDVNVLLNNGNGGFVDATATVGVGVSTSHWQPVICDFNGDGWMDIFQAVDFRPNKLLINSGDGTFVDEAAEAGVNTAFNEMGVAVGDLDNDLDMDIFVTNIADMPGDPFARHNVLFMNETVGRVTSFSEEARSRGVAWGRWGWGTTFADVDNSGTLDIVQTNGFNRAPWATDTSKLFLSTGDFSPGAATFTDASASWSFNDADWGSGLISADVDRDGDLDLVQTCMSGPVRLCRSTLAEQPGAGGWAMVQLRNSGGNTRGIGAVVRVTTGGVTRSRLVTAGSSTASCEPAEAFFGLGDAAILDRVEVVWPDGATSCYEGVPAGMRLTLWHPSANAVMGYVHAFMTGRGEADFYGDAGTIDINDVLAFALVYNSACR